MLHFRRMETHDIERVTDLAVRALAPGEAKGLKIDRLKVKSMVWGFALSTEHYHLIAFRGNVAVGAVAMYVVESPFFAGKEAHVVMAFADQGGQHLMKMMMDSFNSGPAVRLIWSMNDDAAAERFERVLQRRYGLNTAHHNLVLNKGS